MLQQINRIIQLDLDLKFTTNVKELWDNFNYFSRDHLMALAHENQPVYRFVIGRYEIRLIFDWFEDIFYGSIEKRILERC